MMGPREIYGTIREHWRITFLVVLVVIAAAFLFLPHFAPDDPMPVEDDTAVDTDPQTEVIESGFTNLQFGLELSGGTRVRAPLVGLTADGLTFEPDEELTIEETVAAELGIETREVNAHAGHDDAAIEVTADAIRTGDITRDDVAAAIQAAGFDVAPGDIQRGTTDETVDEAVRVVEDKIRESPFARGTASQATSSTGERFVVVEVPGATRGEVVSLIEDRGVVEVVAHYPTEDGDGNPTYENQTVLERDHFQQISPPDESPEHGPHVPVVLTEEGAERFTDVMIDRGFTSQGVGQCQWDQNPEDPGWCLLTVVDGEVVYSANVAESLAETINSGDFMETRNFVMTAHEMGDARDLAINLRAGALPAPFFLEEGTQYFLEPSLAADFKIYSLITGLIAILAVAGVVFLRYGRPRVAVPMIVTASSEVFLLLGFAAAIGYPLDLAAIAGFIAVVGTGVDDLIIIADEILQQGDVSTSRVFESRFRKAFWVIGVAAATTIIAMTPLAFMSLGDLTGFALFVIIGVLIGVLITRPAYGDILRILMTREQQAAE